MLHVQFDIIAPDEKKSSQSKGEAQMKKLMTLMLGLSLAFGTVAAVFAQDPPKKDAPTKGSKKKSGKKKEETPKKDGGK